MDVKHKIILGLSFCIASCESREIDAVYSHRIKNKITIDGKANDWANNLEPTTIYDREIQQGDHERVRSDNSVKCFSVWDQKNLYFFFDVSDSDLRAIQTTHDHEALYLDDMVEILLDPRREATDLWLPDDIVYHINILKAVKDDRGTLNGDKNVAWNGKAQFALDIKGSINEPGTDYGYTLEIAIPWIEIGLYPTAGIQLGFNFANGDNDGKGRQLFDWMGAWPMRTPSKFGTLTLKP